MASENEMLADIVAQMRDPEGMGYTVGNTANGADISEDTAECMATFADRIEAAWKRERVEIATKAATQGVKLTNEKWRSEFEAVDSLIAEGIATEVDEELQHPFHLEFAREKIAAALAAAPAVECPPSNVAALHEALGQILYYLPHMLQYMRVHWEDATAGGYYEKIESIAKSALATAAEREGDGDGR